MPIRAIQITRKTAVALRRLINRAADAYLEPQDLLHEMKKRCAKIAGPMGPGEIAALCKQHDRIEVVTHGEYLSDVNKGRWRRGTCKSPPSGILVRSSSFMRKHSRLLGYWGQAVMVEVEWSRNALHSLSPLQCNHTTRPPGGKFAAASGQELRTAGETCSQKQPVILREESPC
jgi:hypothetical protein